MTKQILTSILLIFFTVTCSAQSVSNFQSALDNIFIAFKNRDYTMLKPFLDPNMKIGDFPRGKNDMIVPQILAQLPVPDSYSVTETINEGEYTRVNTIYVSNAIPKMKRSFLFNKLGKVVDFDVLIGISTSRKEVKQLSSLPKRIEINFKVHEGIVFTKAFLNGKEEDFLLDSGAPGLLLNSDNSIIRKMSYIPSNVKGTGVGGDLKNTNSVNIETFEWNGIKMEKSNIDAIPLGHLFGDKYHFAGLVGYDIIKDYQLIFDYKNNKITGILNTEVYNMPDKYRELTKIPFKMNRHIPVFDIIIGGKKYKVGLDTGASTNLFYAKYAENHKALIKKVKSENIKGASGDVNAEKSSISVVNIGGINYENMRFAFEDSTLDQLNNGYNLGIDGLLGYQFLKSNIVSVDFKAKEIRIYEEK
ncbi:hypothetical protein CMU93_08965 [Elizabethkingia anophelis]|nr:hypothetical protein [Elizabethkingia anophelis]